MTEDLYPHEWLINLVMAPFVFLMVIILVIGICEEVMAASPRKQKPKYARYIVAR
jgi:hypothetical protein